MIWEGREIYLYMLYIYFSSISRDCGKVEKGGEILNLYLYMVDTINIWLYMAKTP